MSSTGDSPDAPHPSDGGDAPSAQPELRQRELGTILDRVERRSATADDWARLNSLLMSDAACGVQYLAWMKLNAELAWHFFPAKPLSSEELVRFSMAESLLPDEPAKAAEPKNLKSPSKSPVLGFLGGAMDYVNHSRTLMFSLVALVVSGWFIVQIGSLMLGRSRPGGAQVASQPGDPNSPEVSHPPGGSFANSASPRPSDSVAFMTTLIDCHWRVVPPAVPPASAPAPGDADTQVDADKLFHVGSELPAGQQLDLVRGLAEITFRSGARIVLNGPAHFTVGSPLGGKLQVGKLTARVPHDAHGFTVDTPAGKVVDLGTEFGVAVAHDRTMEVEVFVGGVSVSSSAVGQTLGSSEKLAAGHAAKVVAGQPVASITLDPHRFIRGLGPREDNHVAQAAYLDFVRSLKPVVWFRMEGKDTDRVLHDEMGGPDAKLLWDGPGNPFVEGRLGKGLWLRGSALKDCAVLPDYPKAEHGKLTVSAWAYGNFRSPFAAIATNWSDALGQFYFGLENEGVDLAVFVLDGNGKQVVAREGLSHPFPTHEWQHVAFVADGSTVRLYRQGNEVASLQIAGTVNKGPARALVIGNRTGGAGAAIDSAMSNYWWDGRLDEIAVFNDALSADDIRKLAAAPPQ